LLQQLSSGLDLRLRYVTIVNLVRYQIVTSINYLSPALNLKDLGFSDIYPPFYGVLAYGF